MKKKKNNNNNNFGQTLVFLQIHFSSIFLPWHRWYLFFHERILASLVGDPTFSLMFWNWDDQRDGGNVFPAMFARNGTALFDRLRNPGILNNASALVNLVPLSNVSEHDALVAQNLNSLHAALVSANTPELFFGGPYRSEQKAKTINVTSITIQCRVLLTP
jgi:polyphenol oxidase